MEHVTACQEAGEDAAPLWVFADRLAEGGQPMAEQRADAAGFDPAAFVRECMVAGQRLYQRLGTSEKKLREQMLIHSLDFAARLRPHLRDAAGDDGKTVTKEWLRLVGFVETDFDGYCELCLIYDELRYYRVGHWQIGKTRIRNLPTRGHVRRLLAALGVPLEATDG